VTNIYLDIPGSVKLIVVKIPGVQPLKKGGKWKLDADPRKLHLFNSEKRSLLCV
jgi:alpha-glucoside transport system ATP-binding protein